MAEKEYIERGNVIEKLSRMIDYCEKDKKVNGLTALFQCGDAIMDVPAADVVEVRHGRWIPHEHMSRTPYARNYDCSECGISPIECENYCPNCGAKMDGGKTK